MSSDPSQSVAALQATGRSLLSLVSGASAEALSRQPGPGEWSAAQVLGHLADAEMVYGVRLRMVLTQPEPTLVAYDEGTWADRFGPLEEDVRDTLARWRAVRDSNVRVLMSVGESEWGRAGHHQERGRETLADLVTVMAAHDRNHLDQMRRALAS